MNCYNHPDKVAVGLCHACYKAGCYECATDRYMFSCNKTECIEISSNIRNILKNNPSNIGASNKIIQDANVLGLMIGVFLLAIGVIFCLYSEYIFGFTFIAFGSALSILKAFNMSSKKRKLNH